MRPSKYWAIVSVAALAVGACGGSDDDVAESVVDDADATNESTSPENDRLEQGTGSLTMSYPSSPNSFDPHNTSSIVAEAYQFPIYDRLTSLNPATFEIEPMLATGWTFADDGSSLEMTLRDDVTFHDGKAFNAEAVRATIERGKTMEGSTAALALESIESIEVVDDFRVRFALAEGRGAELPANLATVAGSMISPAAIEADTDLSLDPGDAGSGPYLIDEFVPDQHAVFLDAPGNHWTGDDHLERLEIQIIPAVEAQLNGFQSGQLDLVHVRAPFLSQADNIADSDDNAHTYRLSSFGSHYLALSSTRGALTDERVRQAVNHAIDREAIASGLLEDQCVATSQPYPEAHWAFDPDLADAYPFDPERASELLAEAGHDGLPIEVAYPAGQSYEQVAQVVQSQLEAAGFDASILPGQSSTALRTEFMSGAHDAWETAIVAGIDPASTVTNYYTGGIQIIGESDLATVEEIAEQASDPTLDQDTRADMYRQIWTAAQNGAWGVPICHTAQSWLYAEGITGVEDMTWATQNVFDARALGVDNE